MNYQASNPESLSETPERLSETKTSCSKQTSSRSANLLHKLEQLHCRTVAKTFDLRRASPGSDVIPRGGGDRFTHYRDFHYQNFVLVRVYPMRYFHFTKQRRRSVPSQFTKMMIRATSSLRTNRVRCALNMEIVDILHDESVSGAHSSRASL